MSLSKKSLAIFNREIFFMIVRIGTGAVVARMLGPAGMGIWMAFDLLTNYSRVFCGPRFEIASVHFLGQKECNRNEVLSVVNVTSLSLGIIVMFLVMANQGWIWHLFFKGVEVNKWILFFVAFNIPLLFLRRNYLYFLLSREDARAYNLSMLIFTLVKSVVTLLLLIVFKLELWAMAIGLVVGSLISLAYAIVSFHSQEKFVLSFNRAIFLGIFKFSTKVYFSEAVGFLTLYLSNMITALTMSPSMLAFFSMGKGKAELTGSVTNSIGTIFYPKIANLKGQGKDTTSITTFAFRTSLFVMIVISIILALFAYPTTLILYGKEFLPLVYSFYIIIPSLALYNSSNLQRQYFLGIGRADLPLKISIIPLILQAILCYFLIPIWDFVGASIAVSVTFLVTSVATIVVYHKMANVKYADILLIRSSDVSFVSSFVKERLLFYWSQIRLRFSSLQARLQPRL